MALDEAALEFRAEPRVEPPARPFRGAFAHAAPGSFRLSSERESAARDLLFAVTSIASICGLRAPVTHTPIFVIFAGLVALSSYRSLANLKYSGRFFIPPLLAFMAVHLTSAFQMGRSNGLIFTFQAITDSIFVWAFVVRYSQIPMQRFLKYAGIFTAVLLLAVLGYHFAHRRFYSFKFLADPKAVFDLLPIMMLVMRRSRRPFTRRLYTLVTPLLVIAVLLSGERKAYILLAMFLPFLVNFRSPMTYVLPVILVLTTPVALTFDKTGYVSRQVGTLLELSNGRVERTMSNDMRKWAVDYAGRLYKENPVFGVGTNRYYLIVARKFHRGEAPHNEWMRVAAENGTVGLIFYGMTVAYGFIGLFRARVFGRKRTTDEKIIAAGLFFTFLLYFSFEALDFIVMMSFIFTPMVQFLRLSPNEPVAGRTPPVTAAA